MSILVKKAGILTTLQDLGRKGFRRFGINPNGAMDQTAVRLINSLLGNDENAAVLEMHFPASEFFFEEPAACALGGADFSASLDGESVENWRIFFAGQGTELKFSQKISGNRAYLAVQGGFKTENWLASASTNLKAKIGGLHGRKLQSGDRILFNQIAHPKSRIPKFRISNALVPFYSKFPTVRLVAGAEFEMLTAGSRKNLFGENFLITQNSDRMGFRLAGAGLYLLDEKELVSSAVNFGTIQLLPDGQLIVLMADHQTSGGYPRIANVVTMDLPLLAQLGANDKVAFHLISLEEAENLLVRFEKDLNFLKIGVNLTAARPKSAE
jgi:antagonist of KipI